MFFFFQRCVRFNEDHIAVSSGVDKDVRVRYRFFPLYIDLSMSNEGIHLNMYTGLGFKVWSMLAGDEWPQRW